MSSSRPIADVSAEKMLSYFRVLRRYASSLALDQPGCDQSIEITTVLEKIRPNPRIAGMGQTQFYDGLFELVRLVSQSLTTSDLSKYDSMVKTNAERVLGYLSSCADNQIVGLSRPYLLGFDL